MANCQLLSAPEGTLDAGLGGGGSQGNCRGEAVLQGFCCRILEQSSVPTSNTSQISLQQLQNTIKEETKALPVGTTADFTLAAPPGWAIR